MRLWLIAFTLALLSLAGRAQEPFPDGAPVQFSYREILKDVVVTDPDSGEFVVATERTISIEGSAPLTGYDLSEIDETTIYNVSIGNFDTSQISDLGGQLGDDENFPASPSDQSVEIPISGLNYEGDPVQLGTVGLSWTANRVSFTINIGNSNQALTPVEYDIGADFYREKNEAIDAEDLTASFTFGPFNFNLRTVFSVGTASSANDPQERVPEVLSTIRLDGAIDYLAPTLTVTAPTARDTSETGVFTIFGKASDKREIKRSGLSTIVTNSEVAYVEVQVGTSADPGDFVEATLDGENWVLPNVELQPGKNSVTVRATDAHGNVTTVGPREITFLQSGSITVQAEAVDFAAGTSVAAGTVKGAFFTGTTKAITAFTNGGVVFNTRNAVEAGQMFSVTAVPAPGAVFNGWTATINGLEQFTAVAETISFETLPNLVVRAEFVPNPFAPVLGTYQGLVTGDTAAERGTIKIVVGKTGAFSGRVQIGTLTLPLKGKVLGDGRWSGVVKKGAFEYAVQFILTVMPGGDKQLVGTVSGGGLSADLVADLKDWRKARGTDPGKLATAFAGSYNALITPPAAPESAVPFGIGFAKVTVTPLGAVTVVGKLGDGTPFKVGTTLVQRESGPVLFPLFFALNAKRGSIAGNVTFSNLADSDLAGPLTWEEPATAKVEPQAFEDTFNFAGSRYTKPATGTLAILAGSAGAGQVTLSAPAFTVPATPAGVPLQITSAGTLTLPLHAVTLAASPVTTALKFQMRINPNTGLFSGSFRDSVLARTIPFAGAVVQKPNGGNGEAGGVFTRGNRAGAVTLKP